MNRDAEGSASAGHRLGRSGETLAPGHRFGRTGERLAAGYLERRGWCVAARNWRFHHKEIDLVVRRGRTVAFVEVKARAGDALGHPLDAITAAKRRELAVAARGWIALHGRPGESYRFDAVAVIRDGSGTRVEHLEDAWRV